MNSTLIWVSDARTAPRGQRRLATAGNGAQITAGIMRNGNNQSGFEYQICMVWTRVRCAYAVGSRSNRTGAGRLSRGASVAAPIGADRRAGFASRRAVCRSVSAVTAVTL
ncbi:hypothetical protein, partial [Burkholderia ambifaria]|uniref:hypothetical protein n=1 Tax=Burkholderia ambifaria TaxID=152480 RepID=UPI001E420FD5